ncbi:MAG: SDR family NAD(P)-dependent oxidoreductase [Proteobacteria bacterium]|nr:SDR family NAD(P)-dependent oxidoreductase [Pseudomonadota bacterium]
MSLGVVYRDLPTQCARIDARNTRYRFDLERDLPWTEAVDGVVHIPDRMLSSMGVDVEALRAHPEGYRAFQWAAGLEICRTFSLLEHHLRGFIEAESDVLGPTRSATMLSEEELKHIAVFDRYSERLLALHPDWAEDFERAFAPNKPELLHTYARDAYPSGAVQHYFCWIETLFFEEYTLYLHECLDAESEQVGGLWLEAHRLHRVEETQHVVTDIAHLQALDLTDLERRACATGFWTRLERTFELFLGVSAARRLVLERYPELAGALPGLAGPDLPIYTDVLGHRLFRGTRGCAPSRGLPTADAHIKGRGADPSPGTLVDALDAVAGTELGVTWVVEGEPDRFETYGAIRERALHALDALRQRGQTAARPLVLRVDRPEQTVVMLWASLLGGMVPVILAPSSGRDDDAEARVRRVLALLDFPAVVSDEPGPFNCADLLKHRAAGVVPSTPSGPKDVALIQFSSGSTGDPKGVQLSHANLLANAAAIFSHVGGVDGDRFASWLPLHHDMGLIGYHLLPIVNRCDQLLMRPRHFLKRPGEWLGAMSRHRSNITATPTFGLATTADRVRAEDLEGVDLSALRIVLLGAEPISWTTMQRFEQALSDHGFSATALTPGYGLAEASLCLTAMHDYAAPSMVRLQRASLGAGVGVRDDVDGVGFVCCGTPLPGMELRIVDGSGQLLTEDQVGEIEARGPSITSGYFGPNPRPQEQFRESWLRTGDLGFVREGRLFITGRVKDIVFLHGAKHYAHDVEDCLGEVEGLHPRRIAVFGSYDERLGRDILCVAVTIRSRTRSKEEVVESLSRAVAERFGRRPDVVLEVGAKQIPRTTSGKLQRGLLRERYEAGELQAFAAPAADPVVAGPSADLTDQVRLAWAEALEVPASSLGLHDDFREVGGTSLQAAMVHAVLEDTLNERIPHEALLACSTIAELAAFLGGEPAPIEATDDLNPVVRSDDVAIIGMGLRFPGANTLEEFWQILSSGEAQFGPVPEDRWDHARQLRRDPKLCPTGAFVDGVFDFDPSFFAISPAEGAAMDPRQRLFLEACASALQHAGVGRGDVGVFASSGESPITARTFLDAVERGDMDMTGRMENGTNSIVAARVSRAFELTGGAVVVQAACASSVVAIHQARRAIQLGECTVALAGGVEITHSPMTYALFGPNRVLSSSGQCRPFTAEADGFVPGEGAGAVVLKSLAQARADGDRVLAVIRGSAVTNDGQAFSGMAPNPRGQIRAARRALAEANIEPKTVSMIEAHGTATAIGDAVELRAMRTVYGDSRAALTSVKSNIGHLLSAAGVAAVIKSVLAIQDGVAPPIAAFSSLDPRHMQSADGPRPIGAAEPLHGSPFRVAVNALGIGGTNCHMILEAAPPLSSQKAEAQLVALSGPSKQALAVEAMALHSHLDAHPEWPLEAICAALGRRAQLHTKARSAEVVETRDELLSHLELVARGPVSTPSKRRLVVVFPGPGSQVDQAGRGLRDDPVFAEALREVEAVVKPLLGLGVDALLASASKRIDHAQPAVFAVSWASWKWLLAQGVRPDAVLGHSAGEYAALAASGALTMKQALTALIARGTAMAEAPAGAMAAVLAPAETVAKHLVTGAEVACFNSPDQVVISGPTDAVAKTRASLEADGVVVRELAIPCAAHSTAMEHALPSLAAVVDPLEFKVPTLALYSTYTGARATLPTGSDLVAQLRAPVRFQDAVHSALSDGCSAFVEVGGAAILSPAIQAIADASRVDVLCAGVHRTQDPMAHLVALAELFEAGQAVRVGRLSAGDVPLPEPSYTRSALPLDFPEAQARRVSAAPPSEGVPSDAERAVFEDHRAKEQGIAPAAWMFERMFTHRGRPGTLEGVAITAPAFATMERWRLETDERVALATSHDGVWTTHASGRFTDVQVEARAMPEPSGTRIEPEVIYDALASAGLDYGPTMRTLQRIWHDGDTIWADLAPGTPLTPQWIDPSVLDGAFQAMAAFLLDSDDRRPMLGFAARRITVLRPLVGPCRACIELRHSDRDTLRVDLSLQDALGRTAAVFEDFAAKRLHVEEAVAYGVNWVAEALPAAPPPEDVVAIIGVADLGYDLALAAVDAGATVLGPAPVGAPSSRLALRQAAIAVALRPTLGDLAALAPSLAGLERLVVWTSSRSVAAMARALGAETGVETQVVFAAELTASALLQLLASHGSVRRFEGGQWTRPSLERVNQADFAIEPGQVVWIPGGAGGIGSAFAERLGKLGATVVISGRRPELDPAVAQRLADGEVDFTYLSVDLGDFDAVAMAKDHILDKHGRLDGLVHCAGSLSEGLLIAGEPLVRDDAKFLGSAALEDALSEVPLEFVALVSSLTSLVPSPGQAAYAAANGALDDLAHVWSGTAKRVVSLNYGPWGEVGMVADEAHRARMVAAGLLPLKTEEAVEALFTALGTPYAQVLVVSLPMNGERRLASAMGATRAHTRIAVVPEPVAPPVVAVAPAVVTPAPPPMPKTARTVEPANVPAPSPSRPGHAGPDDVTGLIRRALGRRVRQGDWDPDATFADLGIDSLGGVELVRTLEAELGLQLYPTLLFEHPTPNELGFALRERIGAGSVAPPPSATPPPAPARSRGPVATGRRGDVDAAWVVRDLGGEIEFVQETAQRPALLPDEIAIAVQAWGVNFIDVLARVGLHPVLNDPSFVPGHEVAGRVTAVGSGVADLKPGDRVGAFASRGGYARTVHTKAFLAVALPDSVTYEDAAATLITGLTALVCVEDAGRVAEGDAVLVHAASGATGSAVVQLALQHGATVFGTASTPEKRRHLAAMGVQFPLDYGQVEAVISEYGGVDAVIDSLSGDAVTQGVALLNEGGRFVEIGAGASIGIAALDPQALFLKNQSFHGANLSQIMRHPVRLERLKKRWLAALASGSLRPAVGHRLAFDRAPEAHTLLRERRSIGKIVLVP